MNICVRLHFRGQVCRDHVCVAGRVRKEVRIVSQKVNAHVNKCVVQICELSHMRENMCACEIRSVCKRNGTLMLHARAVVIWLILQPWRLKNLWR